jgi:16S rRNA (cytosine967-C5)-methyltransferase
MGMDRARQTALNILMKVLEKGGYSHLVLDEALKDSRLKPLDRTFATELVYGTIRHLKTLDHYIAAFSKLPLKKISKPVLNILRMGVYQILFMRVPASAAVNESVELGKRYGHKASAGFVNALLRKVANEHTHVAPQKLQDQYSFPSWMIQMWQEQLGEDFTRALMEGLNQKPKTTIRVNTLKTDILSVKDVFTKNGIAWEEGRFVKEALIIKESGIETLEGFREGLFTVQDESSMMAGQLLDPKPMDTVLDICAAPGGKSAYMASLMGNKGSLLSADLHPHRVELLKKNLERLGVCMAKTQVMDAMVYQPTLCDQFDKVLVDVPCSGLGVIRKKPEIKWEKSKEDVVALSELQYRILKTVSNYVKVGGSLVYSTCTINRDENEHVVDLFLKEHPSFDKEDIRYLLPKGVFTDEKPHHFVTLYPHLHGVDGFFIAKIKRAK